MSYTLRACSDISEIGRDAWESCANPVSSEFLARRVPFDPFVSYPFLHALQESRSAVAETGWAPYHLVLEDDAGQASGIVPMYLKSHSQGRSFFVVCEMTRKLKKK